MQMKYVASFLIAFPSIVIKGITTWVSNQVFTFHSSFLLLSFIFVQHKVRSQYVKVCSRAIKKFRSPFHISHHINKYKGCEDKVENDSGRIVVVHTAAATFGQSLFMGPAAAAQALPEEGKKPYVQHTQDLESTPRLNSCDTCESYGAACLNISPSFRSLPTLSRGGGARKNDRYSMNRCPMGFEYFKALYYEGQKLNCPKRRRAELLGAHNVNGPSINCVTGHLPKIAECVFKVRVFPVALKGFCIFLALHHKEMGKYSGRDTQTLFFVCLALQIA